MNARRARQRIGPTMAYQIRFVVGRYHVGTAPEQILSDLSGRLIRKTRGSVSLTLLRAVLVYARHVHTQNRALYARIIRGGR
jgi:hypothetical protein